MLALLSPIIGIFGSLLPSFVRLFEKKMDYAHDLEITKLRLDAAEKNIKMEIALEELKADVEEGESLRSHDMSIAYTGFFAALRASIRPVLTYLFFFLFVAVKLSAAISMFYAGFGVVEILNAVWDVETMALFSTMLAFWFGSRSLEKMENRITGRTKITMSKK